MSTQPLFVQLAQQRAVSSPDPSVQSWSDIEAVPTVGLFRLPVLKVWVDAETGRQMTTRLIESTADTNLDAGILRPRDYNPDFPRVWFLAS
jgi:hypothetical protein